ncbi:MAG: Inositol-1-monophosphatase, partial [uncultured Sphingomonadaceae bacterium]
GSRFRHHHRHAEGRAQGRPGAAPRLQRGRAAASVQEGPRRLRVAGRQARGGDDLRGAAPRASRLGVRAGGRRRDRGRGGQAALDRRSARRHDQLPPRHPALLDRDRGAGARLWRRLGRDHAGARLSAADGRDVLGGEGQGRVAPRPPPARVRAARPCRRADRDGHSVEGPWRPRPVQPRARRDLAGGGGHSAVRIGGARPRLGRGGAVRRLFRGGRQPVGRRRGNASGARGGRLRQRLSRVRADVRTRRVSGRRGRAAQPVAQARRGRAPRL